MPERWTVKILLAIFCLTLLVEPKRSWGKVTEFLASWRSYQTLLDRLDLKGACAKL